MPQIKIENLLISYPRKKGEPIQAVTNLNVSFPDRQISCLVGASGCGKTSLLRAIAGVQDYEGSISFDDVDLFSVSTKERNIAYINQDIVLYPHLSVFQNIAFPLVTSGAPVEEIRKRVYEVAKAMKIDALLTRKPKQISEGQAQRVCLAKALVKRAYVYLLDEPFSNLDERNRELLRLDLKAALKEFGATAIFVTHSIKEAYLVGDRIFVMDQGEIVDQGDTSHIAASSVPQTEQLVNNDDK